MHNRPINEASSYDAHACVCNKLNTLVCNINEM